MLATAHPAELCDEALLHANWLHNILPSSRNNFTILVLKWNHNLTIQFNRVLEFGAFGFAFIYNVKDKKLLPQSEGAHLFQVKGDQLLIRVYIRTAN